jgi:predicted nucleic acid-binding protein
MKYLLDTDILIDVLRGYAPSVEWLATLTETPAVVSVCVMELVQGCRGKADLRAVEQLVAPLEVWYPTDREMQVALAACTARFLKTRLSVIDAIVGAVAQERATPLCTFNTRHYKEFSVVLCQPYPKAYPH